MNNASKQGNVKALERLKLSGDIWYSENAMVWASEFGHIEVLDWWFTESGLRLMYTNRAFSNASFNGHFAVLDWWFAKSKISDLSFECPYDVIDSASERGQIKVLDWWLKSGLSLKYTSWAVEWACINRNIDVIIWWMNSGLPIKYNDHVICELLRCNYLFMINHIISMKS